MEQTQPWLGSHTRFHLIDDGVAKHLVAAANAHDGYVLLV
jgi:hypothetical protein